MRVLLFTLINLLFLCSCAEDTAFGGGTGTTGTTGITGPGATNLGTVAIKTSIPKEIPDGAGGTLTTTFRTYAMGNADSSIAYILAASDGSERIFKPTGTGPVELDSSMFSLGILVSGDGDKVLSNNGVKDIIDYVSGGLLPIGAALGTDIPRTITDAGDRVAFNSRKDLDGANAALDNQLYTLTTDGSEVYSQVTLFTSDYLLYNVQISGDGTKIVFASTGDVLGDGSNADGSDEIFLINTDGSGLVQLTTLDSGISMVRNIRISADGGMVSTVLDDYSGSGVVALYTIATASPPYPLTYIADRHSSTTGSEYDLSADGTKIAYLSTITSPQTLYLIGTDGSSNTAVLNTVNAGAGGFMDRPHINSDGSQISFESSGDYGATIPATDLAIQIYTFTLL